MTSQALIKRVAVLEAKMRSVAAALAPAFRFRLKHRDDGFTVYERFEEPRRSGNRLPPRQRPETLVALSGKGLPEKPFF